MRNIQALHDTSRIVHKEFIRILFVPSDKWVFDLCPIHNVSVKPITELF